jgi:hypothetical protein
VILGLLACGSTSCLQFNDQTAPDAAIDGPVDEGGPGPSGSGGTGGTGPDVRQPTDTSSERVTTIDVANTASGNVDVSGATVDGGAPPPPDLGSPPDQPAAEVAGWPGTSGVIDVGESKRFNLGSGELTWSIRGGQRGYFYVNQDTVPAVEVANATAVSGCEGLPHIGYEGVKAVHDLIRADTLAFTGPASIVFGTRAEKCNTGFLVFRQGNQYGVIDFLAIDFATSRLTIRYWLAAPGVVDFSAAP